MTKKLNGQTIPFIPIQAAARQRNLCQQAYLSVKKLQNLVQSAHTNPET
jgi:hypothetical protein